MDNLTQPDDRIRFTTTDGRVVEVCHGTDRVVLQTREPAGAVAFELDEAVALAQAIARQAGHAERVPLTVDEVIAVRGAVTDLGTALASMLSSALAAVGPAVQRVYREVQRVHDADPYAFHPWVALARCPFCPADQEEPAR